MEILKQFAEMPQLFDEDDALAQQLAERKAEIVDLFHHDLDRKLAAAGALARLDPSDEVVPVLMAALDGEWKQIAFAAYCLGFLGVMARAAEPKLIELLRHENTAVVANSAHALGRLRATESVPCLLELLDGDAAAEAAEALGEIGAHEALPSLDKCLRCDDRYLRLVAAKAISTISGDPSVAVDVATKLLSDEEEWVVANACRVLAELAPAAEAAISDLQRLLNHHDQCVRQEAGKVLQRGFTLSR